jgi:hypothetical protein|tara:strand:+ start:113 stop:595 length:483 start_codon:yes stop_codon:yes gene_type:complete
LSFKIKGGIGSLGYCREGGGRVLYIFNGKFDFAATDTVVSHVYTDKHESEIDFAEYDPSKISTDRFEIEDEVPLSSILVIHNVSELSDEENKRIAIFFIKKFLLNLLNNGVAVIFVDLEGQVIFEVGEDEVNNGDLADTLLRHYSEATLFAREYDHIYDY